MKRVMGFVVGVGRLAALAAPRAADDLPRFGPWSAAVNLGPIVNTTSEDACPTLSKSGLSLFFRSNRPGGYGLSDLMVSQRDSLEDPWGEPVNLGPAVNSPFEEACTGLSPDEHWLVIATTRPGADGAERARERVVGHAAGSRQEGAEAAPPLLGCCRYLPPPFVASIQRYTHTAANSAIDTVCETGS